MKRLWLLVMFYCIVHGASGDMAVTYEGMDQATVTKLVQQTYGVPFDFVNQAAYNAFVAAHPPSFPGPNRRPPASPQQ